MLNVNYKNRIGYCFYDSKQIDGTKKPLKLWFCHANCLCAMMHFGLQKERVSEEKTKNNLRATLWCFFMDIEHLKRCSEYITSYHNFHFFAKNMDPSHWTMVKYMTTKLHLKVTIE